MCPGTLAPSSTHHTTHVLRMRGKLHPTSTISRPRTRLLRTLGQTSANPGHKFSEVGTQLLRTLGTTSENFAEVPNMRAKFQFVSSGQTSENPGQNFSEVGTQLLRAPRWSISAYRLEPPSSQTQPKSIYVGWVAMGSLQTLSTRVAKLVRVAKSMLQSSLQPLTWPTSATLRGPARPLDHLERHH